MLTASSIVTSFVGGRAIDRVGLNAITVAAAVGFFLTLLPAIYVVTTSAEAASPSTALGSTLISPPPKPLWKRHTSRSPKRSGARDKGTVRSSGALSGLFAWDSRR